MPLGRVTPPLSSRHRQAALRRRVWRAIRPYGGSSGLKGATFLRDGVCLDGMAVIAHLPRRLGSADSVLGLAEGLDD
jgi:hypothetical protein